MLELLGNVSMRTIGRIDWDPYLPVMYARLMKGLRLPVYFKQKNNNLETQPVKNFTFSSAARWIIGTLVIFHNLGFLLHIWLLTNLNS
jgi:hypothetical protein